MMLDTRLRQRQSMRDRPWTSPDASSPSEAPDFAPVFNLANYCTDDARRGNDPINGAIYAIQEAMPLEGGTIEVPEGYYRLDTVVNLTKLIHFVGVSREECIFALNNATSSAFYMTNDPDEGAGSASNGSSWEHLTIRAYPGITKTAGSFITGINTSYARIEDCDLLEWFIGISLSGLGSGQARILNCDLISSIVAAGSWGIGMYGSPAGHVVDSCYIDGGEVGIYNGNTGGTNVVRSTRVRASGVGLHSNGGALTLDHCVIDQCTDDGVQIVDSPYNKIRILTCDINANGGWGIDVDPDASNILIATSDIYGNTGGGVRYQAGGGANLRTEGNDLQGNTGPALTDSATGAQRIKVGNLPTSVNDATAGGASVKTPSVLHLLSRPFSACGDLFGSATTGVMPTATTNANWGTANLVLYMPFTVYESSTAKRLAWMNGSTLVANVHIGIFDESLARLVQSGAVTPVGAGVIQAFNIADTVLAPGRYYLALGSDNASSRFGFFNPDATLVRGVGVAEAAAGISGGNLVTPATLAAYSRVILPWFGIEFGTLKE